MPRSVCPAVFALLKTDFEDVVAAKLGRNHSLAEAQIYVPWHPAIACLVHAMAHA